MHIDDVWPRLLEEALAAPLQSGGEQGTLHQIPCARVCLSGSREQFLTNRRRKLSPVYASAELLWYLKRTKSIEMIAHYAPSYTKFAEANGEAYGAYGGRLVDNAPARDLLYTAIAALKEKRSTKRCVIALWRPDDLIVIRDVRDVPCTIYWKFQEHDSKLDMMVHMRSNDLWKGFLYDVYVNTCIHRYVAASVGMLPGTYYHVADSLHLYESDATKAREAIVALSEPGGYWPGTQEAGFAKDDLELALEIEEAVRRGIFCPDLGCHVLPTVLKDAMLCCLAKCSKRIIQLPRSPSLRSALEEMYDRQPTR